MFFHSRLRSSFKLRRQATFFTFLLSAALLPISSVFAEITLPHIFGNNMVLQSETAVPVWGWALPGEEIKVEINEQIVTTNANAQGQWRVELSPENASGPFELIISSSTEPNKIVYKDVYFGEVWICAGQSNMSFPLKRVKNSKKEISEANFSKIRIFTVPAVATDEPQNDVNGQWQICSSKKASDFSAVAYYFGRNISETLKKPIGLIVLAWGGSTAEAWISQAELLSRPALSTLVEPKRMSQTTPCQRASYLHNGMLSPICPYAIKGVVWYQGESNANRANQYGFLFPILITNWREDWGQGDFPFYFVQLPNFMRIREQPSESAWAELREAQHKTLSVRNVGEIVTIDIGNAFDLHPQNKETVGNRLANIALAQTYNHDIPCLGPEFDSMKIEGNKILLTFKNDNNGLRIGSNDQCDNAELRGFAVAGKDQKFYWAKAEIQQNTVIVYSPEVPKPIAVRYAWADNPICNLTNGDNLPASPFRTDDWPGVTVDAF